jgi:xanthine dehydrogenase FAD-binding subunit
MPLWNQYLIPETTEEAVDLLNSYSNSRVIAGGTDLLLELQQDSQPKPDLLVDVTRISEMTKLEIREKHLFIGASLPLKQIATSPLIKEHAFALQEACNLIGGPQVRNVATLGGNVAHALPAGDGTIALLALDAWAVIVSTDGRKRVPLIELYSGPGLTALKPNEILEGLYIRQKKFGQSSAFKRVMRPQGVALPVLNIAVWLELYESRINDVRISIGPAGRIPQRATLAENELKGQQLTDQLLENAHNALLGQVSLRTSAYRATFEYRKHISNVLLKQTVKAAYERAELQV